ncbi:MAG TPA: hypothetical protein VHX86_00885 [Tepidisphaeraceae bacterium]|jgi:hypothetical protein|nr:hypothetical protein [Tepidisphaeraceae bacterium]
MQGSGGPVDFSSRQVNAEIKRKVWPTLRVAGFDKFNARKWPAFYRVQPTEPPEYGCHARLHLEKRILQTEYPRLGIWYVRPDGSNLAAVIQDALSVIVDVGLPWLEKFTSLPYALAEYQRPREVGREEYVCAFGTFKAAAEGSALAFSLKDYAAAKSLWRSVVESDRGSRHPEWLEQARAIIALCDERRVQS